MGEVVGGEEGTGDAGVETSETVVGGVDNGILEAAGILQVQVKLAVLGVVRGLGAGADVGLEGIETIGDDLVIVNILFKGASGGWLSY